MTTLERTVLISAWVVSAAALGLFVPKKKRRNAVIAFLSLQILTWSLSLIYVEIGWLENPAREFQKASSTNFTFNYFLYPASGVLYTLLYPTDKRASWKLLYTVLFASSATLFVYLVDLFTNLIENKTDTYLWAWLTFMVCFYAVRKYNEWFFRVRYGVPAPGDPK